MLVVLWTTERAVRFFYGTALEAGRRISGAIPVLFGVMLFGWWAYVSNSFFDMISLLRWGFDFEPWTPPPSWSSYLATAPISEYLLDLSGYLALMALAFIGSLYLLSRQGKTSTEVGLLASIWILAVLGLMTILPQLTGLLGQRWNIAFQLFSGPLVGVGLVWVISLQRKRAIGILLVMIIAASLAFANISSPTGNQDTNVYSPNTFV